MTTRRDTPAVAFRNVERHVGAGTPRALCSVDMPFSQRDYPTSLKNFSEPVRHKAIEVANALLEEAQGEEGDAREPDEGRAIAIGTAQAERWAREQGVSLYAPDADADSEIGEHAPSLHVTPREDGWAVIAAGAARASKVYDTQRKAIDAARQRVQRGDARVYIHGEDGRIRRAVG